MFLQLLNPGESTSRPIPPLLSKPDGTRTGQGQDGLSEQNHGESGFCPSLMNMLSGASMIKYMCCPWFGWFNLSQLSLNKSPMNHKLQILRFIEQCSEHLQLTYQSCLQSIQTLNILDHYHYTTLNKLTKSPRQWKTMALALLSLCSKMHQIKYIGLRQLAKLVHPNSHLPELDKLGPEDTAEEKDITRASLTDLEEEIKEWEVRVLVWLKWKLAVPLLYDEVLAVAVRWDQYTSFLPEFPLKFEAPSPAASSKYSENHNFLASKVRICLYNLTHLIGEEELSGLSERVRKMSVGLFIVLISSFVVDVEGLIREKTKLNNYILSPRLSLIKMLEDFCWQTLELKLSDFLSEIRQIEVVLLKYTKFRQQSREKKEKLPQKSAKTNKKPIGPSQEKENLAYFVHNHKKSKHHKCQPSQDPTEAMKSRSRSKKEKGHPGFGSTCEAVVRDCRGSVELKQKGVQWSRTNKKKSNSTKSILSKHFVQKKQKERQIVVEVASKKEKKSQTKSKISKRSEKSHMNSKIVCAGLVGEEGPSSKSACWLIKSGTVPKSDNKSNHSSIRIKIR